MSIGLYTPHSIAAQINKVVSEYAFQVSSYCL